jgi:putative membrane protein
MFCELTTIPVSLTVKCLVMKKSLFFAAVAASFAMCSCSMDDENNSNPGNLNYTDQQFIVQASYSNHAEISAGQVAVTKGMRDSIKMFGQMMVMDHTMSQQSLDSIAGAFNMSTPSTADSMHIMMLQQMSLLSGHTFDTAYIHAQVSDHQKTFSLFQDELNNGNNQRLKTYVNQYLSKIQMHYNMAVQLSAGE